MASITKTQVDYALKRLCGALQVKLSTYKEAHCLLREEKKLTVEQKEALVFAGGVPFKRGLKAYCTEDIFDFSKHENPVEYDKAKLKKYEDKLQREKRKAEDSIILGDAADAMNSIARFEKL